jgi:RimJ/RimL family protein N-acetyltransferase
MNKDAGLQSEFLNLKGQTASESSAVLNSIINRGQKGNWSDFALIKLTKQASPIDRYDDSNSKTIGFITLADAGMSDFIRSGFKMLLNYGIIATHRGKGLMTHALNMRLEKYKELGINLVPAYIKGDNPASERVLQKCGFIRIVDDMFGSTYVKNLTVPQSVFNQNFQEV